MAQNGENISGGDATMREVLDELRQQREEVRALRAEVQGNSQSVVSEVKKLKTQKDISWKYQGNKIQYEFNSDLCSTVEQLVWSIDNQKFDYSKELCTELSGKLKKRNKLVRIADTSAGGWDTVKHYEANPVASDSEDESKIYKAEARALKRKRSGSHGRGVATASYSRNDGSVFTGTKSWDTLPPIPRGKSFRGGFSNSFRGIPTNPGVGGYMHQFGYNSGGPGPCYACGEYFHFRKNCPNINRPAVPSGNQSSGGK